MCTQPNLNIILLTSGTSGTHASGLPAIAHFIPGCVPQSSPMRLHAGPLVLLLDLSPLIWTPSLACHVVAHPLTQVILCHLTHCVSLQLSSSAHYQAGQGGTGQGGAKVDRAQFLSLYSGGRAAGVLSSGRAGWGRAKQKWEGVL